MTIASAWLDGWVSGYIAAFRVKSDKSATESFKEYEAMRERARDFDARRDIRSGSDAGATTGEE